MAPPFFSGGKLRASEIQGMVDGTADVASDLITSLFDHTGLASVATNETRTLNTYGDLATVGPTVTLTSQGTRALIFWSMHGSNNTANCGWITTVSISGATILAAADANGILWHEHPAANISDEDGMVMLATINPGTNIYKVEYKRAGAASTASIERRKLIVYAP